jgi:hypothetical protein
VRRSSFVALVIVALCVGCTTNAAHRSDQVTPRPSSPVVSPSTTRAPSDALASSAAPTRSSPPDAVAPAVVCPAVPHVVTAMFTGHALARGGDRIVPVTVDDSGAVLSLVTHGGQKTISLLRPSGDDTVILSVAQDDQLTGASVSGTDVVFFVSHSPNNPMLWTLYHYNRVSGVLSRVKDNPGGTAHPQDGPFPQAVQVGHTAYWEEGLPGQRAAIQRLDLNTGAVSVARTGHPAALFTYRDTLLWLESPAPDALTTVHAFGKVPLPAPVTAALSGASSVTAAGTRLAWVSGGGHDISSWSGSGPPEVQYQTDTDHAAWEVHIAGRLITWETPDRPWALDTVSRRVFPPTPQYGFVLTSATTLLITYPGADAGKGNDPVTIATVATSAIPRSIGC